MTLAPDPFDSEVERLLADPDFKAELDKRPARVERGDAVVHEDAGVRRRLRDLGVSLLDPTQPE
jgi:hypothetical protein